MKVLTILFILFLSFCPQAWADNRTALVIGNGDYRSIDRLDNPVNDALDMKQVLERLGFDVILKTNADRRELRAAVRSFGDKISKGGVGLFYYAGHGVQVDGINYMIPVGVDIKKKYDVEDQALKMRYVLGAMEAANNKLNIIILDSCRNNPFRGFRGSSDGLARMDAPTGSIIAYATAPGKKAADGQGRNGTYTASLLNNISVPGVSVKEMLNKTGLDVMSATDNDQVPWTSSTPVPKYFLAGGDAPVQLPRPSRPKPLSKKVVASSTPSAGDSWTEPVTGMAFVWVPEGCFQMGSNSGYNDEKPVHNVCLDGFWMGKYEVTQGQWETIMGNNPSGFKSGNDFPVENVSWNDTKKFISKLNQQSGNLFKLPTEAQWEYAARSGGKDQEYAGGNIVDKVAWYRSNSGDKTHRVGTKSSNGLGLYDMTGNVWEWCKDVYDSSAYSKHSRNNPVSTTGGSRRVLRGGSWNLDSWYCRAAGRRRSIPSYRNSSLGLRLVLLSGQ